MPLLFGVIMPAGGTQTFPDYPVPQPSHCAIHEQQKDVSVGLELMESPQDQMTYFHTALGTHGFLPVLIVIHNRSNSDSLLLEKDGISYAPDQAGKTKLHENSGGQKTAIVTTAFIPIIGPFISMGVEKQTSEVMQNLLLRQLQSETISPGSTVSGFVYVAIPKKGPRPNMWMQVPVGWAGSDRTSVLKLAF